MFLCLIGIHSEFDGLNHGDRILPTLYYGSLINSTYLVHSSNLITQGIEFKGDKIDMRNHPVINFAGFRNKKGIYENIVYRDFLNCHISHFQGVNLMRK